MKKVVTILLISFCFVVTINSQTKIGLSAQGAISLPVGDFEKTSKVGLGGLGTITVNLVNSLDLALTSGYLSNSIKDIDGSTSFIPLVVGIRYYFIQDDFKPYFTAQTGVYFFNGKVSVPGLQISPYAYRLPYTDTKSETYSGLSGGFGFLYLLNAETDLDINATYNIVSDVRYLVLAFGIHYSF